MREEMPQAPWWNCLVNVPKDREDPAFRPLMRVFADPTASETWGVYNGRSEGHQVVNFFENFRLDTSHEWIRWLLDRFDVGAGPVLTASWSYELEVPPTYLLCDVVIGFCDQAGPGVIIIEAKRTSEKLAKGVSSKDDPREAIYLNLPQFSEVKRTIQLLLVSVEAAQNLPSSLRAMPNLLTWEEIGAAQRQILSSPAEDRSDFERALRLQHSFLGIGRDLALIRKPAGLARISKAQAVEFQRNVQRYVRYVKRNELSLGEGWLAHEPGRAGLIAREAQTGSERQYPFWREGAGLDP